MERLAQDRGWNCMQAFIACLPFLLGGRPLTQSLSPPPPLLWITLSSGSSARLGSRERCRRPRRSLQGSTDPPPRAVPEQLPSPAFLHAAPVTVNTDEVLNLQPGVDSKLRCDGAFDRLGKCFESATPPFCEKRTGGGNPLLVLLRGRFQLFKDKRVMISAYLENH